MSCQFYGRRKLLDEMAELWRKPTAKLMTCRGRRRIGKSTLVEHFAREGEATFWSFEGLPPQPRMTNQDQLNAFARRLAELAKTSLEHFNSWFDAFKALAEHLPKDQRVVLLLDEISWMGKYDPNFPGELKFAWDQRWHSQSELIVVVCGSVSSWINASFHRNRCSKPAGFLLAGHGCPRTLDRGGVRFLGRVAFAYRTVGNTRRSFCDRRCSAVP